MLKEVRPLITTEEKGSDGSIAAYRLEELSLEQEADKNDLLTQIIEVNNGLSELENRSSASPFKWARKEYLKFKYGRLHTSVLNALDEQEFTRKVQAELKNGNILPAEQYFERRINKTIVGLTVTVGFGTRDEMQADFDTFKKDLAAYGDVGDPQRVGEFSIQYKESLQQGIAARYPLLAGGIDYS